MTCTRFRFALKSIKAGSEILAWIQVLKKASEKQALVEVALNTHGTRAVQKLIETLSSPEQVSNLQAI